jgi:hypothetical protein
MSVKKESERQDKRPACGYKVQQADGSSKECGSEDRVYEVSGHSRTWNTPRKTPVCEKHLPDAWKKWNVDSATPVFTDMAARRWRDASTSSDRVSLRARDEGARPSL